MHTAVLLLMPPKCPFVDSPHVNVQISYPFITFCAGVSNFSWKLVPFFRGEGHFFCLGGYLVGGRGATLFLLRGEGYLEWAWAYLFIFPSGRIHKCK